VRRFAAVLRSREPGALDPLDGDGLPDEVQPVAAALNDLLARLKESVERERSFIADAAHELRTPLTALDLQVQSLRASTAGGRHEDAVQQLEAGVARAARLVEQLLALAREERDGRREHEPVALPEVAREVLEELLPLADRRGIDLGMERADAVRVAGDREALRSWSATCSTMPFVTRPRAVGSTCPWNVRAAARRAQCSPFQIAAPGSRLRSANGCSIDSIECQAQPPLAAASGWRWCARSLRITTRGFASTRATKDADCE
jgi:hypothetical protein